MSLWRHVKYGMRVLTNRRGADQDIADEIHQYLDELTAAFEAKGMTRDEARRAARMEMGSVVTVGEQMRAAGWEHRVSEACHTCRIAVRRLARDPVFTLAALLTLALGIGATTAIFTVIDGVLLQPLPYPHSDRLVALLHTAPGINLKLLKMSPSLYFTYREESRVFDRIALWNGNRTTVTGLAEAEEAPTLFVTCEFLEVLQVHPAMGRGFTPADCDPGSGRAVLLSDGYWKRRFGRDDEVLGKRIVIDGNAHEIIGILPASFEFMDEPVSLVMPMRLKREEVSLISFGEDGIGRLKPGVTLEQANADVARCLRLAPAKFPLDKGFSASAFTDARISPRLRSMKDYLVGDVSKTLWPVMGAVGMLLLIACANVANLMLVRADGRQGELAVRVALGAGWGRISWELLAESLIVAVGGGALGLILSFAVLRLLPASHLTQIPRWHEISLHLPALAFAGVASAGAAIIALIPVWKYARPQILDAVRNGGNRSFTETWERRRARGALVVVQVAFAVVLLIGSGLMIRTFISLRAVDPGFSNPSEVQAVRISIPEVQVKEPAQVEALQETILTRFKATPGVSAIAIATSAPMEGSAGNPVYAADRVYAAGSLPPVRQMRYVSPGWMAAIGSRLIAGRDLTWDEIHNAAAVAMVSENMARELWHSPQAALGRRIRVSLDEPWTEVVGVVADLRDDGIDRDAPTIVYWPLITRTGDGRLRAPRHVDFLIRSPRAGSATFVQELRKALSAVNPNLPLANVRTLQSVYDRSLARTSFALLLLVVTGSMALVLGVIGIYGVVAYSVSRRRRDIGIRIALGSSPAHVIRMFVREGLVLSCVGAACGLFAAWSVTRLMGSLLFGVSPMDPLTYGAVCVGLIVAAVVASWLPARRAAAIDPMTVLRAE